MKRLVFVLVIALALTSLASATLTEGTPSPNLSPVFGTLVNFDDQPTGNPVNPTQYVGVGVASIADANNQLFYFPGTQSLPNYVGTGGNVGWAMDTTIALVNPTNAIGIGLAGPGTVELIARNGAGAIVDDYTFPFLTNDYWVVSDSSPDIQSLEIISPFIAIDDLQFGPLSPTPEPSSILLLMGGLTSAAYARLRRR